MRKCFERATTHAGRFRRRHANPSSPMAPTPQRHLSGHCRNRIIAEQASGTGEDAYATDRPILSHDAKEMTMATRLMGAIVLAALTLPTARGLSQFSLGEDGTVSSPSPHELYAKTDSLARTMLATRAQLERWQTEQAEARRAVRFGAWHGAARRPPASRWTQRPSLAAASSRMRPASHRSRRGPSTRPTPPGSRSSPAPRPTGSTPRWSPTGRSRLTLELSRHERFGGICLSAAAVRRGRRAVGRPGVAQRPASAAATTGSRATAACPWPSAAAGTRRCSSTCALGARREPPGGVARQGPAAVLVQRGPRRLRSGAGPVGDDRERFPAVAPPAAGARSTSVGSRRPAAGSRKAASRRWSSSSLRRLIEIARTRRRGDRPAPRRTGCRPASAASDARWLDLCVTAAELQAALRDADAAARRPSRNCSGLSPSGIRPSGCSPARPISAQRLLRQAADRLDPVGGAEQPAASTSSTASARGPGGREPAAGRQATAVRQALHLRLRLTTTTSSTRGSAGSAAGCTCSRWPTARSRRSPRKLRDGVFDRYDLSFDARRIAVRLQAAQARGIPHLRDRRRRHAACGK